MAGQNPVEGATGGVSRQSKQQNAGGGEDELPPSGGGAAKKPRRRRVTRPEKFNSRAADAKVASLASNQHGLITRPQAIACGMSPTSVKTRLRTGRWEKVHRGVYAIAGSARTRQREILAACLAAGPDAVATSETAAELYRLPKIWRSELPIIAVPHTNKVRCPTRKAAVREAIRRKQKAPRDTKKAPRPGFSILHRHYVARRGARAVEDGIPVASVAWTYVELAGRVPERKLELSITEAIRRKLVTLDELIAAAAAAGERKDAVKLRRILASDVLREAYRSLGEIMVRQLLRDEGYADTVMNKPIHHAGKYIGSPDAQSERARLIVEVDGPSHATEEQRSIDRIQTACYEALGWAVVRMKPAQVGSRALLRGRIAVAQKRRRETPVNHAEFLALWRNLTDGLPPTHIPPQGEFPTAAAHYL